MEKVRARKRFKSVDELYIPNKGRGILKKGKDNNLDSQHAQTGNAGDVRGDGKVELRDVGGRNAGFSQNSKRNQSARQNVHVPRSSVPAASTGPTVSPTSTFWTSCPHCKMQYQYLQKYQNDQLKCQKCNGLFKTRGHLQYSNSSELSGEFNVNKRNNSVKQPVTSMQPAPPVSTLGGSSQQITVFDAKRVAHIHDFELKEELETKLSRDVSLSQASVPKRRNPVFDYATEAWLEERKRAA
ncbi:hypothetical protein R1flu_019264 [Riccia fluitans]|uniref:Zinc beta-ribbon domain-containing protein n=1 Tax=Riccia fluitans TaxID=41844 RepID=A0ABD1ZI62_9MARC